MAAKPPKPPGNFLSQFRKSSTTDTRTTLLNNSDINDNNNNSNSINNTNNNNTETSSALENTSVTTTTPTTQETTKPTCNCTNISIMHLFHEMKQEFPTIPDPIVQQCVNENCHQRENCIQVLRHELALNPIPVQAYPAKVLQQQRQQQKLQLQQQQQNHMQTPPCAQNKLSTQKSLEKPPPATHLKPTRPAPPQPTLSNTFAQAKENLSLYLAKSKKICRNQLLKDVQNSKNIEKSACNDPNSNNFSSLNNSVNSVSAECDTITSTTTRNTSDMPVTLAASDVATTTPTPTTAHLKANGSVSDTPLLQNNNQLSELTNTNALITARRPQPQQAHVEEPPEQPAVRARPTTLNLQRQPQQQQRQLLNIQLQQHFQQRYQQQQLQQQQNTPNKPMRKAPLPPIPPKPIQFNTHAISQNNSPHSQQQQVNFSNESSLTSPISSGESEISVNVSLSSPTSAHKINSQQQQLKSPIRHRSVINVQPEPPYTRDFLISSPTSNTSSQKSFTSVNLTLRQPSSCVPQSTIDISAGPGLSGVGSGLTYSSTSYDARRGFQKNFHITVTDEGGVFSASRIRPQNYFSTGEHEQDGPTTDHSGVNPNPLRTVTSEQNGLQHQYHQPFQQQQQQQPQHIVASNTTTTPTTPTAATTPITDMCLLKESDDLRQIFQRQKMRRDKLANVLRDNKKKFAQVEQEINILAEPINPGESERLDNEIQQLRVDCERMLNEIENVRRSGPTNMANNHNNTSKQQQSQQAFPRQRAPRPPPPPSLGTAHHSTDLDFVQIHNNTPSPTLTTALVNSPQLQSQLPYEQYLQQMHQQALLQQQELLHQQMLQQHQFEQQQQQHQQQQQLQQQTSHTEVDDEYSDSNTEEGDDEEPLEMWACNMCTFRNHPQLNICECCDNVRILPGMIRIVPSAAAAAAAAAAGVTPTSRATNSNANLENDANLTQQFALHT